MGLNFLILGLDFRSKNLYHDLLFCMCDFQKTTGSFCAIPRNAAMVQEAPCKNHAYHRNLNLDFDGAWNS
jgi:hypothetical protein